MSLQSAAHGRSAFFVVFARVPLGFTQTLAEIFVSESLLEQFPLVVSVLGTNVSEIPDGEHHGRNEETQEYQPIEHKMRERLTGKIPVAPSISQDGTAGYGNAACDTPFGLEGHAMCRPPSYLSYTHTRSSYVWPEGERTRRVS